MCLSPAKNKVSDNFILGHVSCKENEKNESNHEPSLEDSISKINE